MTVTFARTVPFSRVSLDQVYLIRLNDILCSCEAVIGQVDLR